MANSFSGEEKTDSVVHCLLSKPDKWSDGIEGRHENSATCLNKLYLQLKKIPTLSISKGGTHDRKINLFSSCLNGKTRSYAPSSHPMKKEENPRCVKAFRDIL